MKPMQRPSKETLQVYSRNGDLKAQMPAAYITEAEASATGVASILYHELLNCKEQATVWSPSSKSTLS